MQTLPKHIAIIMDGNGRWAQNRGLSRLEGHRAGVDSATEIVRYCGELGITYLTLYAFSSENWKRPPEEVFGLMGIMRDYLSRDSSELVEKGVCVQVIGSLERLPKALQMALLQICEKTKTGQKLHLTLALSYGSRAEITQAAKQMAQDVLDKKIALSDFSEELFERYLETRSLPDPDLFIRTSGEMRLSNFLLWQLSYSELYMTPILWPDFKRADLDQALESYSNRQRRFGAAS
ncbi:MAG: isoprenyl transferase [Myxococcaceae bacterium]